MLDPNDLLAALTAQRNQALDAAAHNAAAITALERRTAALLEEVARLKRASETPPAEGSANG